MSFPSKQRANGTPTIRLLLNLRMPWPTRLSERSAAPWCTTPRNGVISRSSWVSKAVKRIGHEALCPQGRTSMRYALMFSAALLLSLGQGQPASAQSPADLVKQAVDAIGG